MQALAIAMKDAYDTSKPVKRIAGQWHAPFLDELTCDELFNKYNDSQLKAISTGRCARVSYLNHDGIRDISDDIKLHDRLLRSKPAHLSPFEHCAIAMPNSDRYANFTGWQSYRNILEGEAKEGL